jgi:tetratricopeptide (TPR) repeat protein
MPRGLRVSEGSPVEAIEAMGRAFRLNPHPPGRYYWYLGYAQYAAGHYEEAVETLRHDVTRRTGSRRLLAASLAQLGLIEDAREEARQFLAANPHFTIKHWAPTQHFENDADRQHFVDGYLKAGLPMGSVTRQH